MDKIYRFEPLLKEIVWGGNGIARFKGIKSNSDHIGESWELSAVEGTESIVASGCDKGNSLSEICQRYGADLLGTYVVERYGRSFPLLLKLIDARENLSVQVHPNDDLARKRHNSAGKTEMWYVVDCEADAKIYSGLSMALDANQYHKMVANNTIMDAVKCHNSYKGQFYFIPAGTIHAIGAGNLIAEIQQSSDITYRIYDYNRKDIDGNPRQLHTEMATDAIDYTFPYKLKLSGYIVDSTTLRAVDCEYFTTDFISVKSSDEPFMLRHDASSFTALMSVDGVADLYVDGQSTILCQGETVLIPAKVKTIVVLGESKILSIRVKTTIPIN